MATESSEIVEKDGEFFVKVTSEDGETELIPFEADETEQATATTVEEVAENASGDIQYNEDGTLAPTNSGMTDTYDSLVAMSDEEIKALSDKELSNLYRQAEQELDTYYQNNVVPVDEYYNQAWNNQAESNPDGEFYEYAYGSTSYDELPNSIQILFNESVAGKYNHDVNQWIGQQLQPQTDVYFQTGGSVEGVPEGWDIQRYSAYEGDSDLLNELYHHGDSGMSFEEFSNEWQAMMNAGIVDGPPTQADYQGAMLWGTPGKMYADNHKDSVTYWPNEGTKVSIYSEDSLSYAINNDLSLHWVAEMDQGFNGSYNEFIALPDSIDPDLIPHGFDAAPGDDGIDGMTVYYDPQSTMWVDEFNKYFLIAWSAAATILTAGAASSAGAAATTAAAAAGPTLSSAAGIGAAALTQGAISTVTGAAAAAGFGADITSSDYWKNQGIDSFVKGGITGGFGFGADLFVPSKSFALEAVVKGTGAFTAGLATGQDLGGSIQSGVISGLGSYASGEYGRLPGMLTTAALKIASGADEEGVVRSLLVSGATQLVGKDNLFGRSR